MYQLELIDSEGLVLEVRLATLKEAKFYVKRLLETNSSAKSIEVLKLPTRELVIKAK